MWSPHCGDSAGLGGLQKRAGQEAQRFHTSADAFQDPHRARVAHLAWRPQNPNVAGHSLKARALREGWVDQISADCAKAFEKTAETVATVKAEPGDTALPAVLAAYGRLSREGRDTMEKACFEKLQPAVLRRPELAPPPRPSALVLGDPQPSPPIRRIPIP